MTRAAALAALLLASPAWAVTPPVIDLTDPQGFVGIPFPETRRLNDVPAGCVKSPKAAEAAGIVCRPGRVSLCRGYNDLRSHPFFNGSLGMGSVDGFRVMREHQASLERWMDEAECQIPSGFYLDEGRITPRAQKVQP